MAEVSQVLICPMLYERSCVISAGLAGLRIFSPIRLVEGEVVEVVVCVGERICESTWNLP